MKLFKEQLEVRAELHWWNCGRKTLSFEGTLGDLLKKQNISFTIRRTDRNGIYTFNFKSVYGISFKSTGTISDFVTKAKQFVQMELVRMGDKSQLYVNDWYRPTITVNF